ESPCCTAETRTPIATTNAAGSNPRNTTSDHHTIARRGLAEKNARNNRHSADWRNRRTLAPPELPMLAQVLRACINGPDRIIVWSPIPPTGHHAERRADALPPRRDRSHGRALRGNAQGDRRRRCHLERPRRVLRRRRRVHR